MQWRETCFAILQKAPYGVLLIDQDERCLYVNPEFTNITGHTLDDIPTVADWFREAFPDPAYRQEVTERWVGDTAQTITATGHGSQFPGTRVEDTKNQLPHGNGD